MRSPVAATQRPAVTVDRLRRRDPDVLDELLSSYGRELQGVAYLILRDLAAAEDVVVDTLLAALDRGAQLREGDALRGWLLRIAANRALSVRRTSARMVLLAVPPERPVRVDEDERLTLLDCVERLAPRMRAAVVLHYYADLPVRAVAETLGTSENTVKSQLREALAQMRVALAEPVTLEEAAYG